MTTRLLWVSLCPLILLSPFSSHFLDVRFQIPVHRILALDPFLFRKIHFRQLQLVSSNLTESASIVQVSGEPSNSFSLIGIVFFVQNVIMIQSISIVDRQGMIPLAKSSRICTTQMMGRGYIIYFSITRNQQLRQHNTYFAPFCAQWVLANSFWPPIVG